MIQAHDYFDREYFTLHDGKRRYVAYLIDLLRRSGVSGGRVLDVGSGLGFFLWALSRSGLEPFGLEKSAEVADRARELCGASVSVGDADEPFPFPDAYFSAVTLFDVIEHFHRVPEVLAECCRVLEPAGKLFVITLNAGSLARPLLGKSWSFFLDPTHVTLFSKSSLRQAIAGAGFQVQRLTTMSNFYLIGEGNPWLKPLRRIGHVLTTPWLGDSLLAVAEKRVTTVGR
ncbi:MAG: class I SAM-dependent methyltransferase [Candidatus Binataceae bacterium]